MSWKDLLKSFAFWRNPLRHNFGKCDQPPIHCTSSFKQFQLCISIAFTFQLPDNELEQLCFTLKVMYYYKKFWRNPLCHNFAKCDWLRPPCTVALTIITIIIFIYTNPFSFTCIRILPSIGFNHIYSCQETYISLIYLYFPIKKSKRFQRQ